jgi:hypothetical protein
MGGGGRQYDMGKCGPACWLAVFGSRLLLLLLLLLPSPMW